MLPQWPATWPLTSTFWVYTRHIQKVSSHVIWKIETFIEKDTTCKKHCTQDNDTSVHFKVGTLGPHTILPITISCPIRFSWISLMVWNLFPLKVVLVWGKARSHRVQNLGCRDTEWPGWFDVLPKNYAQDVMHEQVCCGDEAANHQLPIVVPSESPK